MLAKHAACTTVASLVIPFNGLVSVYREISNQTGQSSVEFVVFVSSIIETGTYPDQIVAVGTRLATLGIPTFNYLSPP